MTSALKTDKAEGAGEIRSSLTGLPKSDQEMKSIVETVSIAAALALVFCGGLWLSAQTPSDVSRAQCEGRVRSLLCFLPWRRSTGGDRAPALMNNQGLRSRSESQIHDMIRDGRRGEMPAFPLSEAALNALAGRIRSLNIPAFEAKVVGAPTLGERFFFGKGRFASCQIVFGAAGKSNGLDLSNVGQQLCRAAICRENQGAERRRGWLRMLTVKEKES
jgi:hypothetical protein